MRKLLKQQRISLFFLLFIYFILNLTIKGQSVRIVGSVITEKGNPLSNVNVFINSASSSRLLAFDNTGNSNSFSIEFKADLPDSFVIKVNYIGFVPFTRTIYVREAGIYPLEVSLRINYEELAPVTIKPLPIWKRGDTTFLNVAAFKEGDERKLIDIIANLPNFRINALGQLLYKGKKIETIKIGGSKLFADKPELLLKSFPIDVIKNLQVIENQSTNELLKGLEAGTNTILNLDLDKGAFIKPFGDIETGLGTLDRFKLNPVVFSLKGKTKIGLISNTNNNGDNVKPWLRYRELGSSFSLATNPLISTGVNAFVENFADSRYIKNLTSDNQLQVNAQFSKKLKTTTSFVMQNDDATQLSIQNSFLFSDSIFRQRFSRSLNKGLFKSIGVKENIEWALTNKSMLNFSMSYFTDKSKRNVAEDFIQSDSNYSVSSSINNKWQILQLNGGFTSRLSTNKAIDFSWLYNDLTLPQKIGGLSPFLFKDFAVPNSSFNRLLQPIDNKYKSLNLKISYLAKKGQKLSAYNVYFTDANLSRNSTLRIRQDTLGGSEIFLSGLSGAGIYKLRELYTDFQRSILFFKIPLFFKAEVGFARISSEEVSLLKENIQARYLLSVSNKRAYSKVLEGEGEISVKQTPPNIYFLNTSSLPNGFASFQSYQNIFVPSKVAEATYRLNGTFKNYSNFNLTLSYQNRLTSYLVKPSINVLSSETVSSTIYKPVSNLYAYSKYSFPFVPLGIKVSLSSNGSYSESNTSIGQATAKLSFLSFANSIELVRNWQKKTFVTIKFQTRLLKNIARKLENSSFLARTSNSQGDFSFKQKLGKTSFVLFNVEGYNNRFNINSSKFQFFTDLIFKKEFTKQKVGITAKLENISNQKEFSIYNSYDPLFQSLLTIPLIKRNFFLSANWSF